MKFVVPRSEISFIPRTKRKNVYLPVLEKDNFRGRPPKSVSDPNPRIFCIYTLNTSLVQIPDWNDRENGVGAGVNVTILSETLVVIILT